MPIQDVRGLRVYIHNLATSDPKKGKQVIHELSQAQRKTLKKILDKSEEQDNPEIKLLINKINHIQKENQFSRKHKPVVHKLKNIFWGRISSYELLKKGKKDQIEAYSIREVQERSSSEEEPHPSPSPLFPSLLFKHLPVDIKKLIIPLLPLNTKEAVEKHIELMKMWDLADDTIKPVYGSIKPINLAGWIQKHKLPLGRLPPLSELEQEVLFPHLTYLKIDSDIFPHFILKAHTCQKLESLVVNTSLKDSELQHVTKHLPNLTVLNLCNCQHLTARGCQSLGLLTNLTSLSLDLTVTDIRSENFTPCLKKLKFLRIEKMTDEGLAALTSLTELTSLNFPFSPDVSDFGLQQLRDLPNLTSLALHGCNIFTTVVEQLSRFPQLNALSLSSCLLYIDDFSIFSSIPKLTSLSVNKLYLQDESLVSLFSLSNLTHLDLSQCKLKAVGLNQIRLLTKLTSLNLSACYQYNTELNLHPLQTLAGLTSLDLSYCHLLTDADLQPLKSLKNLTSLDLRGCHKLTAESKKPFENILVTD